MAPQEILKARESPEKLSSPAFKQTFVLERAFHHLKTGMGLAAKSLCLTPQFCFSSRVLTVLRGGGRERRSRRCAPADERSVILWSPDSPVLALL